MKTVEVAVRFNLQVPDETDVDSLYISVDKGIISFVEDDEWESKIPFTLNEYETMNAEVVTN